MDLDITMDEAEVSIVSIHADQSRLNYVNAALCKDTLHVSIVSIHADQSRHV